MLPMYGMPTMVRSLYFDLPNQRSNPEPRTLDRDLSQAILEYAPGNELVWDKRLLRVQGISGSIRPSGYNNENWEVTTPAVNSVQRQTFCKACRHFEVQEIDLAEATDRLLVVCNSCGEMGAEQYCAVTPAAFIADFDVSVPTKHANREVSGSASSIVASPKLSEARARSEGGCELIFSSQGQVYKVSKSSSGESFNFKRVGALTIPSKNPDIAPQKLFSTSRDIWISDDESPDLKVRFSAPKTTDLLGIRARDGRGLAFFDVDKQVAARRAAWYSAATILQRAIALELDVDSTSIEIASVHLHKTEDSHGAELYLADEHPNGAGLVDWANKNWCELLTGCTSAEGRLAQMGVFLVEANKRAAGGESWSSPDALLKGFRNRNMHGLIDWQLGIELLSVLRDRDFVPGFSKECTVAASSLRGSWATRANGAALILASALGEPAENVQRLGSESPIVGVVQEHCRGRSLLIVAHPLWEYRIGEENIVASAINALVNAVGDCIQVRLIDIFNIERRVSWVKLNIDNPLIFPVYEFSESNSGQESAADFSSLWLATAEEDVFEWGDLKWRKLSPQDLWSAEPGEWLIVEGEVSDQSIPERIRLKRMPGKVVAQREGGGRYFPMENRTLRVIAKLERES